MIIRKRKLCDVSEPTESPIVNDKVWPPTNGDIKTESTPIVADRKKSKSKGVSRQKNKRNETDASKMKKSTLEDLTSSSIPNLSFADVAGCQHVIAVNCHYFDRRALFQHTSLITLYLKFDRISRKWYN